MSNVVGVVATAGAIAALWFGMGRATLLGVAAGTVVGYAGYFVYMVFSAGREMWGLKTCWAVLGKAALAAAWTAGVLRIFAGGGVPTSWMNDLVHAVAAAALGLIALAPLMAVGVWLTETGPDLRRWVGRLARGSAANVR